MTDLVYAYVPCPICGQHELPIRAWICPDDFDEDGHANGFEICEMTCPRCGSVEFETDEQEDAVEAVDREITDAVYNREMLDVGTIWQYRRGLLSPAKPNGLHAIMKGIRQWERLKERA